MSLEKGLEKGWEKRIKDYAKVTSCYQYLRFDILDAAKDICRMYLEILRLREEIKQLKRNKRVFAVW